MKRVALIYDDQTRPETTGVYCLRALKSLVEAVHVHPHAIDSRSAGDFDFFLRIDDGLRYDFPGSLKPSAWWAIDTHMDLPWCKSHGASYDLVFAAQRDGAEALAAHGLRSSWLPLACDPQIHQRLDVPKELDFCFVGNLFPGRRSALVHLLQRRWPRCFVGNRYFEEMARTYSQSRLVFNCSVKNDINMRVFESLACGSLLVTNGLDDNGQDELFTNGRHLAAYSNEEELLDKFEFYLQRPDARERIAQAGREEVLTKHTYRLRMEEILRQAEAYRSSVSLAGAAQPIRQCSACLLAYKRFDNTRQIVSKLLAHPLIDDIVVWNNNPTEVLEIADARATVINSPENLMTYGRFLCMQHAKHDVIYTQDDDCLVHNMDELHQVFQQTPDRIVHALKPTHVARREEREFACGARMALLGWGAFLNRKWAGVLQTYIEHYGEDDLLQSKADRIFSILLNRPHEPLLAEVTDLPGNSGPEAISVAADHPRRVAASIARSLQLLQGNMPPPRAHSVSPTNEPSSRPDVSYFEFDRPDVLAVIPKFARRILEIGCGAGRLASSVKNRQRVHYSGIELDPFAASIAQNNLDHVIVGNVEELDLSRLAPVDCIVCADVLEHLLTPLETLRRLKSLLAASGCMVASIPNVRHHSIVSSLIAGNWTYEAAGLLDQTHYQFFTRRDMQDLFSQAGLTPSHWEFIPGPGYQEWINQGKPAQLQVGSLAIAGMPATETEEFFVYQYLIRAELPDAPASKPRDEPEPASPTIRRAFDLCYFEGILRDGDEYVEVGANRALFLTESGLLSPTKRFHLFESSPAAAKLLRQRFANDDHVIIYQQAMTGDINGPVSFYVDDIDPLCVGNSLVNRQNSNSRKIQVHGTTLDTYLSESGIERIRLLAINAEEAEYDILQSTAVNQVDYITCEFHPELSGIDTASWVKKHLPNFQTLALLRAGEPYNIWFARNRSLKHD